MNLRRSPDRRATIAAHLATLGLVPDFFDAIDGYQMAPAEIAEMRPPQTSAFPLMPGQIGVAASFRKLCLEIAGGRDPFVCILEDDCILRPTALMLLDPDWLSRLPDFDILRLAHAGMKWSRCVRIVQESGFEIVAPLLPQGGTFAQIVTPRGAALLAKGTVPLLTPMDIQLFNDAAVLGLRVLYTVPRQADISGQPSTIATAAEANWPGSPITTKWVRNIVSFAKAWGPAAPFLAMVRARRPSWRSVGASQANSPTRSPT